jgi:predicted TIM-barrel fold metal-dependent hydrolase
MLVILLINWLLAFIPIEQDLELWNPFEGSLAFRDVMTKFEKGPFVVTHIGGHPFFHFTNCNIILSILDPNVTTNLFSRLKGPPFW